MFHPGAQPSRPVTADRLNTLLKRYHAVVDLNMPDLCLDDTVITSRQFEGCNFSGAHGQTATITDCVFHLCFFPSVTFRSVRFERTNLRNCVLACSTVTDVVFHDCNVIQCNFNGIVGDRLTFEDCDLLHSRFNGATLGTTRFSNCNLKETRFVRTSIGGVVFEGSNQEDAVFDVEEGW